jgi:hypothetical protein
MEGGMRRLPMAVIVTLSCLVAMRGSSAQQQAGKPSAADKTLGDSAIVAREWAAWDAVKDKDSTTFVRLLGKTRAVTIVEPDGIARASTGQLASNILKCDTKSNQLDSIVVDHPTETTVLLTYRVTLDRTCGPNGDRVPEKIYSMTVWVRKNGAWHAAAQSITPIMEKQ